MAEISWRILNKIASEIGESFYLLDSKKFEKNYDKFLSAFRNDYPNSHIAYSYKTNYIPKLCSVINDKGGYAEVVSDMEYELAVRIGVLPEFILVNGPYIDQKSLEKYLLNGSIVNLDSYYELELVDKIAKSNKDKELSFGLRCNFPLNNSNISRFGFDVEKKEFHEMYRRLQKSDNLRLRGLHCHFPDRSLQSFDIRIKKMINLVGQIFPNIPEYIDIGGGFFGEMNKTLRKQFNCKVPHFKEYANIIAMQLNRYYKNVGEKMKPKLILEPGTALVSDTMRFVAKILDIKNIYGRNIAITSGSKFNLGKFSSNINLPMQVFSEKEGIRSRRGRKYTDISGYTCIESDYLVKQYKGNIKKSDFVVFDNVGSYSIVFKPPFIRPNVAIIDYDYRNKKYKIVKNAETFQDIFHTYLFK